MLDIELIFDNKKKQKNEIIYKKIDYNLLCFSCKILATLQLIHSTKNNYNNIYLKLLFFSPFKIIIIIIIITGSSKRNKPTKKKWNINITIINRLNLSFENVVGFFFFLKISKIWTLPPPCPIFTQPKSR